MDSVRRADTSGITMSDEEKSRYEQAKQMESVANSLRALAEALDTEAIEMKHNGEIEHEEYLISQCNTVMEEIQEL